MTVGLTSLFSPYRLCGGAIRTAGPAGKELRISRVRPGFSWRTGHARGGGSSVKPSGRRRGMNRSCTGSKKLLLQGCCTHGFTAVL